MTDKPETVTIELKYDLDTTQAQDVMEKIYEIFSGRDLNAQEGLGFLSYTVAFTILSHLGADTFEENMVEFDRITRVIFTEMTKQIVEEKFEEVKKEKFN